MNFRHSILTITHTHKRTHTLTHANTCAHTTRTCTCHNSKKSTDKPINKLVNKTLSLLFWACLSVRLSVRCGGHSNLVIFNRIFPNFISSSNSRSSLNTVFFFLSNDKQAGCKNGRQDRSLYLSHYNRLSSKSYIWIASIKLSFNMFLKMLSFGSKECTKELKLECANFLGLISYHLIVSKFHNKTHDPKGKENKSSSTFFYLSNDKQDGQKMANAFQCPLLHFFIRVFPNFIYGLLP